MIKLKTVMNEIWKAPLNPKRIQDIVGKTVKSVKVGTGTTVISFDDGTYTVFSITNKKGNITVGKI